MKQYHSLVIASLLLSLTSLADVSIDTTANNDTNILVVNEGYAAQIDSAVQCYYEELIRFDELLQLSELNTSDSAPIFTSDVYQERLRALDALTPFDLTYNSTIEAFIHLYVSKKRSLSSASLGRSQLYFPMFEETLDKHNLPLELKYLAVVESGLNPTVRSRAGATGLWQFMYRTGKHFDLTINSYVDDRCDPQQSTEAACKYLSYLYNMFGNWDLALAAYNCGEGRVARAIRRSGGKKSYWDIYPFLPRETRGYVPAFIAVNYLFAYHAEHLIYPTTPSFFPHEIDTVHLKSPVSFEQLSTTLDIDVKTLEELNPVYRIGVVPAYDLEHSILNLPKEKVALWVSNQLVIEKTLEAAAEEDPIPDPQQERYYYVRSGDYLGKIASRNNCTVRQIQEWNGMSSTRLSVGQKLILYGEEPIQPKRPEPAKITQTGNYTYYSIRAGDTLWDIAKAQGVSLETLKSWNEGVDFRRMKPGQKIIVKKA
ncbi:MAG: hypothetical protein Salg2KO_02310 [Salibacteraceae bacterium]